MGLAYASGNRCGGTDVGVGDVHGTLTTATDALRAAGIEDPRLDAEVLLEHATGWDRARLAANPEGEVPAAAARRFGEMVRRRLRREPVAYVLGAKWFRRIELAVDPRVLIPRPETELLVELALELRPRTVLDVGTGCGAIALAIADELPACAVTATDTSAAALEVARANAARLGLADRVRFLEGAIPPAAALPASESPPAAVPLPTEAPPPDEIHQPGGPVERLDAREHGATVTGPGGAFDLVVANLPYVAEPDWDSLAPEVTEWEPREALLAGPDGLDAIRALLPSVRLCISPRISRKNTKSAGGWVALEVGDGQAAAVAAMLRDAGFTEIQTRRDLAGIERVVWGRR
jgi:release factor glutamine methyltransferase